MSRACGIGMRGCPSPPFPTYTSRAAAQYRTWFISTLLTKQSRRVPISDVLALISPIKWPPQVAFAGVSGSTTNKAVSRVLLRDSCLKSNQFRRYLHFSMQGGLFSRSLASVAPMTARCEMLTSSHLSRVSAAADVFCASYKTSWPYQLPLRTTTTNTMRVASRTIGTAMHGLPDGFKHELLRARDRVAGRWLCEKRNTKRMRRALVLVAEFSFSVVTELRSKI